MGIYDRDYYRQRHPGFSLSMPQSMVVMLIVINVAVFLLDGIFSLGDEQHALAHLLAAKGEALTRPWLWWQFVTYGFVHDPRNPGHIIFNMLTLWFLGRDVELEYGKKEFLFLYLTMLVVGSVSWAAINRLQGQVGGELLGASGAVAGVVILFALLFPRRTLLLFFVFPVPAWAVGAFLVVMDLLGAMGGDSARFGEPRIAYTVHLAGAAFAFLYFRTGWRLGRITDFSWSWLRPRPRLRVHDPSRDETDLSAEVDRILEKIHREGEERLTRKERRTLEAASRAYQKRRRTP